MSTAGFDQAASAVAKLSLVMAAFSLVSMLLLVNVEVLGRYVFGFSTFISDEYGAYLFVGCTFFGFAYSLHHGSFLQVNLVLQRLSPRYFSYLGLAAALLGLGLSLILAYETALLTYGSYVFRSRTIQSGTWLFLPQLSMPLGLLATSTIFFHKALKSAGSLFAAASTSPSRQE